MHNKLPKELHSFIWYFLKPYRSIVIIFALLAVIAGFWGPFNSMLIKHIINLLPQVQSSNISLLNWPAVLIILNFIIIDNVTWRGVGYINYRYQGVIKNKIIRAAFDNVLSESNQFFQDNFSGRISNQITTLADNIELILHRISLDFIREISLLIVSIIASFYVNKVFCYILLIWCICFLSFSVWMSRRLIFLADKHASYESLLSGQLVDSITNHSNVRIFSRKAFELVRMDKFFNSLLKAFNKKEMFILILCSVQGTMIAIMLGCAVYFLVHFYGYGLVSIGDFALILGLFIELGYMMWYMMSRIDDFNQAYGKCKQSLAALMIYPEIQDKEGAKQLECMQGQISFCNVNFHYKDTESIFLNQSITIKAGQKVGLVGYSGSGKSTFVNLILRLYEISSGSILIDNQDISECTQDSLRRNIAIIPQDPSLFHRSLIDNIRYGMMEATDEEVINAAKKAHAHEFITNIPQGYNSLVGERGIKLSGGQRQRIAIARAILKNAPILILDEATSQLDSITEINIQTSLWELMQGKTTIVIAHRLSTLMNIDRILVFDQGKIIEDGTHAELIKLDKLYKKLWDAQVGGFVS